MILCNLQKVDIEITEVESLADLDFDCLETNDAVEEDAPDSNGEDDAHDISDTELMNDVEQDIMRVCKL